MECTTGVRLQTAAIVCLLLIKGLSSAHSATLEPSGSGTSTTLGRSARLSPGADNVSTTVTTTMDNNQCDVINTDEFLYNKIQELLEWKTKLINYDVSFVNYSTNPLLENTKRNYKMNQWSRVSNQHGQTLLSLAFNYGVLSLMTLTFGIARLEVVLEDRPHGCFAALPEQQKIDRVMHHMQRDFKHDAKDIQLVEDERICYQVIVDAGGNAKFKDKCCHTNRITKLFECTTDIGNIWLNILYTLLALVRIGMLFFGPVLFVESVERLGQSLVPYVVKLKEPLYKRVYLCRPATPIDVTYKQELDLRWVRKFPKFKAAVSDLPLGEVIPIRISQYDILVDYKKLLTENQVPVGLLTSLGRTFFHCRLRDVGPFKDCCQANMFSSCPTRRPTPWIRFWRNVGRALMILLLPTPFYIRVLVFYNFEIDEVTERKEAVARSGLLEAYENNLIHYLTPSHPVFICIYIIYFIAAALLACGGQASQFKQTIVSSFAALKSFSWITSLGILSSNVIWPFQRFGLFGCVVALVYWPIVMPLSVVVYILYCLPTVYVCFRMLFRAADVGSTGRKLRQRRGRDDDENASGYRIRTDVDRTLRLFDTKALLGKTSSDDARNIRPFPGTRRLQLSKLLKQLAMSVVCVLTLNAVLVVMTECVGFIVEIIVFTLMGIIVNAGSMLKYCTLVFLVIVYSYDTFNNVPKKYLKLNRSLFSDVKGRIHDLDKVTSLPSYLQENFGFKSCEVSQQADHEKPDDVVPRPARHWFINDLVLFIDNEDMPRIPRQLFDEVCGINVAGSPGPVYRGLLDAAQEFVRTVAFLLLVFIVVLSFGTVYRVSSTNQTLATLAGGFLPFVLRTFMQPSKPEIELGTVSFRSKLDEIIINFYQKWAMYDFPFEVGSPEDDEDKDSGAAETESHTISERTKSVNGIDVHRSTSQTNCFTYTNEDNVDGVRKTQNDPGKTSDKTHTTNNNKSKTSEKEVGSNMSKDAETDVDLLIHLPEYSSEGWLQEWSDISEYDDPGLISDECCSDAGDVCEKDDVEDDMVYKSEIV